MFTANILPGQGFQPFEVWSENNGISASGRATTGVPEKTDKKILGMLVGASQKEIDQWKQEGHPITHKIIEYSAEPKAKATDILKGNGSEYKVKGTKNPANLNVTMIYYVEERMDIKRTDS